MIKLRLKVQIIVPDNDTFFVQIENLINRIIDLNIFQISGERCDFVTGFWLAMLLCCQTGIDG